MKLPRKFTIRMPEYMLQNIEVETQKKLGKMSKNTWILTAINEKLNRKCPQSEQEPGEEK